MFRGFESHGLRQVLRSVQQELMKDLSRNVLSSEYPASLLDMELDSSQSVKAASADQATVTSKGEPLASVIHGVSQVSSPNHVDHRGRVFEIYSGLSNHWETPLVYCYAFTVRPNQTKGWGLHKKKDDRYTLISGEMLTLLYDARPDSPTFEVFQKVILTPQRNRQLRIPTGVWHMNICLGSEEALLINHPTDVYDHAKPDRLLLPWNTSEIPVDVSEYFPVQQWRQD